MLSAPVEVTANRALQKILGSRRSNTVDREIFMEGKMIYFYHKSSKHSESVRWEEGIVVSAEEHVLKCRRPATSGITMLEYEGIHIKPQGYLPHNLLLSTLSDGVEGERNAQISYIVQIDNDEASISDDIAAGTDTEQEKSDIDHHDHFLETNEVTF